MKHSPSCNGYTPIISGFAPFSIGRIFSSFPIIASIASESLKRWIDSYVICCIWNTFFNVHHMYSLKQVENLYIPSFQKRDITRASIESLSLFSKFKQVFQFGEVFFFFLKTTCYSIKFRIYVDFRGTAHTSWISTVSGMASYRLLIDLHTKNCLSRCCTRV